MTDHNAALMSPKTKVPNDDFDNLLSTIEKDVQEENII